MTHNISRSLRTVFSNSGQLLRMWQTCVYQIFDELIEAVEKRLIDCCVFLSKPKAYSTLNYVTFILKLKKI